MKQDLQGPTRFAKIEPVKKKIHPTYYPQANVKCACGNEFQVGATKESIEVEVCSACHPFYTGDDRGRARGSQVEKFKERLTKRAKNHAK